MAEITADATKFAAQACKLIYRWGEALTVLQASSGLVTISSYSIVLE